MMGQPFVRKAAVFSRLSLFLMLLTSINAIFISLIAFSSAESPAADLQPPQVQVEYAAEGDPLEPDFVLLEQRKEESALKGHSKIPTPQLALGVLVLVALTLLSLLKVYKRFSEGKDVEKGGEEEEEKEEGGESVGLKQFNLIKNTP